MSAFHRRAFHAASQMFTDVTSSTRGVVLVNVCDVVSSAPLGSAVIERWDAGGMPPAAHMVDGVHLSRAAGAAVARAVRDGVLSTLPVPRPQPGVFPCAAPDIEGKYRPLAFWQ